MSFTSFRLSHRSAAFASALLAVAGVAGTAQAQAVDYSYKFDFPAGSPGYSISQWYILEVAGGDAHFNYGFRQPDQVITSPQGGVLDSDFAVEHSADSAILIGITHDLPGDAAGQEHIVLGMDTSAAGYGENIAWGTLFRNTDEDTLIDSLHHYEDADPTVTSAALQYLVDFAYGDAMTGILDNLAQPHSAWFDPNAGTFTVESWSNGTILGSGAVTATVIPEPALFLPFAASLLPALARRRRTWRRGRISPRS